jgi:7-keto-8-aminopelargonate synthetase-like enzyme
MVFSDSLNHVTIRDGIDLSKARNIIFKHSDMADLERKLQQSSHFGSNIKRLIITDGVFSMEGI